MLSMGFLSVHSLPYDSLLRLSQYHSQQDLLTIIDIIIGIQTKNHMITKVTEISEGLAQIYKKKGMDV